MNLKRLRERFPDEDSCLQFLVESKGGSERNCGLCGKETRFYQLKNRPKQWVCKWCGSSWSPVKGTLFSGSPVPLSSWYMAIWLMEREPARTTVDLAHRIGISYSSAWRMRKAILTSLDFRKRRFSPFSTVELIRDAINVKNNQ